MGSYVSKGISVAFTGDASGTLTAELLDINLDGLLRVQVDVQQLGRRPTRLL